MLSESWCWLVTVAVPECGAQCALTILMPGPDGPIPPAAAQEMGLYFGGSYIALRFELSKNLREVLTMPGAFSLLKAPISTFPFKNLLRHYAKRVLTPR